MAPDAPDPVSATGGTTVVNLTWTLPGPDEDKGDVDEDDNVDGTGGAVVTGAEVQRWNSSTGQWDDIKTVAVGFVDDEADPLVYTSASETYTDAGLADGTDYMYRVRAVNAGGESGWSDMASTRTLAAAPALPTLSATVNGQSVELSWTEPDANGASITRYEIQRFPSIDADNTNSPPDDDTDPDVVNDWGDDAVEDPTDDDVILPMPAGVREHTDSGLAPNTIYYYRIRAVNACNNETGNEEACGGASGDDIPGADTAVTDTAREWSATVTVTTAPQAPARIPRDDASTADVLEGLRLTGGENEVKLEWIEPDPNGSPISEYQIDRWDSVDRQWIPVKRELPASVKTYTDTGLDAGTRYFYRVRAVNAGGEGPWSTLTSAMTEEADE
jgi:titin